MSLESPAKKHKLSTSLDVSIPAILVSPSSTKYDANWMLNSKTREMFRTQQSEKSLMSSIEEERFQNMHNYVAKLDKLVGLPQKLQVSPTFQSLKELSEQNENLARQQAQKKQAII